MLPGVSSAFIEGGALDTPVSYEALAAIGSGLGSAGFVVFDDADDLVAVATAGRAVPGRRIVRPVLAVQARRAPNLGAARRDTARRGHHARPRRTTRAIAKVADGARCSLATQQQVIATSLLERFSAEVDAHLEKRARSDEPRPIAELVDIADGVARIDDHHAAKQPDWTYDAVDSGKVPADAPRRTPGSAAARRVRRHVTALQQVVTEAREPAPQPLFVAGFVAHTIEQQITEVPAPPDHRGTRRPPPCAPSVQSAAGTVAVVRVTPAV